MRPSAATSAGTAPAASLRWENLRRGFSLWLLAVSRARRRPPPAHAQVLGALSQVFVTKQRGGNNCYAKSKAALSKKVVRPDRMA